MRSGQLIIPVLFCAPCRENIKAERNEEKAYRYTGSRKMCACSTRYRSLPVAHLAKGGYLVPRLIPQTRAFRRWIRPDALRLLDFRPGRFHQSCWTLDHGETSLSPPAPFDQTFCRHGPRQRGFHRAPCTTNRRRSAPVPLTNPRRIGCVPRSRPRPCTMSSGSQQKRQVTRPGSRDQLHARPEGRHHVEVHRHRGYPHLPCAWPSCWMRPCPPAAWNPNGQPAGNDPLLRQQYRQQTFRTPSATSWRSWASPART